MLKTSTLKQFAKLLRSITMYAFTVISTLTLLCWGGNNLLFPLRWDPAGQMNTMPFELILSMIIPFVFVTCFKPYKLLRSTAQIVSNFWVRQLRLSSYFHDIRVPSEEGEQLRWAWLHRVFPKKLPPPPTGILVVVQDRSPSPYAQSRSGESCSGQNKYRTCRRRGRRYYWPQPASKDPIGRAVDRRRSLSHGLYTPAVCCPSRSGALCNLELCFLFLRHPGGFSQYVYTAVSLRAL